MKEASYDNDALDWRNICQTFSSISFGHVLFCFFVVDPVSMLKWLDIGTRARKSWGSHSRGGIRHFCANRRCLMCKSYRLKLHQLHQLQRFHSCQIHVKFSFTFTLAIKRQAETQVTKAAEYCATASIHAQSISCSEIRYRYQQRFLLSLHQSSLGYWAILFVCINHFFVSLPIR